MITYYEVIVSIIDTDRFFIMSMIPIKCLDIV